MQAYLQLPGLARPVVNGKIGVNTQRFGSAVVDPGAGTGEIYLRSCAPHRTIRGIAWSTDASERRQTLVADRYELVGYRLLRDAADGTRWMLSTTSTGYRTIEVTEGAPVAIRIPAEVRVRVRAQRHRGRVHVMVDVQGDEGIGCSIYRAGARIPLAWRALDAAGKVLGEGPLRYG